MATVTGGSAAPTATSWPRQALTFTRLTVRSQLKNRRTLLFVLGFPIALYLLESRMFIPQSGPGAATGRTVLAIAFGIFGAFSAALVGFARQLSDDVTSRRYRKFRSLPISPSADFTGRFLGGYVVAVVAEAVVLAIAFFDGGAFDAVGPLSVVVVLGSLFAFCLIAMCVATFVAILLAGDSVPQVSSFLMMIVFFVTGFDGMSVSLLPADLRAVVNYVPNSLAARFQMGYVVGHPVTASGPSIPLPDGAGYAALLVVYTVLGAAVAAFLFGRFVYAGEVGE